MKHIFVIAIVSAIAFFIVSNAFMGNTVFAADNQTVNQTQVKEKASTAEETGPVNVNTAEAKALDSLPGIGPKTAEAIISERNANGPFKDGKNLAERIKGLGPKKLEKMKSRLEF